MMHSTANPSRLPRRTFLTLMGRGGAAGLFWLLAAEAARRGEVERLATLAAEQTQVTVLQPVIIARADWGALPPNLDAENERGPYSLDNPEGYRVYQDDLTTVYNTVVIHHSAMYGQDDLHSVQYILDLHREDRGWADIAYHFLVGKSGAIYQGRPLQVRGTHVAGHNTGTVGVCLLGDLRFEIPTEPQIRAVFQLVRWLAASLRLTHLAGHYEFNPETTCPGVQAIPYLSILASTAGLARGTAGYRPSEEQLRLTATAPAPESDS